MPSYCAAALALAALTTVTGAQIVYNNTQIRVNSTNQYSGESLIGYHIGAGESYIVARSSVGSSFSFNLSATSGQLLDNDIAAGYQLPCFVDSVPAISGNSGPLECGVGNEDNAFNVSSTTPPSSSSPGKITFSGINAWYICAVQSFTYGWVQGTVVGSFGNGAPSGAGVQNCTEIDSIAFAVASGNSTSTSMTGLSSTATSSSASGSVTTSITLANVDPTSGSASQGSQIYSFTTITVVVPCESARPVSDTGANASTSAGTSSSITPVTSNLIASYAGSSYTPIASYTGAAARAEVSVLICLAFTVAALLL